MNLSKKDFRERVRLSPLCAIDIVAKNSKGEVLVGLRKNSPAKNKWFVPGGCIRKNETLDDAYKRISFNELGVELERKNADLHSVGEHFYKDENVFDEIGIDTHYVVITYTTYLYGTINLRESDQHFMFKWMNVEELLEREDVHENTKTLFR